VPNQLKTPSLTWRTLFLVAGKNRNNVRNIDALSSTVANVMIDYKVTELVICFVIQPFCRLRWHYACEISSKPAARIVPTKPYDVHVVAPWRYLMSCSIKLIHWNTVGSACQVQLFSSHEYLLCGCSISFPRADPKHTLGCLGKCAHNDQALLRRLMQKLGFFGITKSCA
jgi:hypothetical protein